MTIEPWYPSMESPIFADDGISLFAGFPSSQWPKPKPTEAELAAMELAEAWAEVNAIAPGIPMEERLGVSVSQFQRTMSAWSIRPRSRVVRE